MKRAILSTLILLLIFLNFPATAGYLIKSIQTVEDTTIESLMYIDGNKVRINDQGMDIIMDFDRDEMYMIMKDQNIYVHEEISKIPQKVEEMKMLMVEEMLKQVPEDQRDQMREMYMNMIDAEDEEYTDELSIEHVGDEQDIAGYESIRYDIYENGMLVESVWIAEGLDLLDMNRIYELFKNFTGVATYEDSQAYIDLMDKGMVMKSIDTESGDTEEVVEIKKTSLENSLFKPDDSFEKLSFKEFSMMMMESQEE
ncbi:MAG: hypothetical protein K9G67_15465 [Bacteroidales bacterium]|nr:hypothetical protein [Bacteroidales bacterium]MCF8344036.1 hypothetical protein [Bacteroidales bacterium]MCF8351585.1 hypothetical protein [Bacteroidales bacterium]MCF8377754.1 hypothetical protein [Bacteroidales bacterium]